MITQDGLAIEVAKLRAENNYLVRVNKVRPHLRPVIRAEAGAHLMAKWHLAGWRTGRMACKSYGMSERTWFYARALLIVARVHDYNGWTCDDLPTIVRAIVSSVDYCTKHPEALLLRVPLSKRPKVL